ncbi:MAG TPA: hypothetical protein PLP64_08830 [Pseudothermotoga sp.]|nr:hypothetical protein [Pseudothermotoga sp.]HOK84312.1 hypothetical protein [Pseudothermotoga sp.]HPP70724.1 hypothetical protein [Pseudothermotoga sp.]
MKKPLSALSPEEFKRLYDYSPEAATGVIEDDPVLVSKIAETAEIQIHLIKVLDGGYSFSGLARFKASENRRVSVAVKGISSVEVKTFMFPLDVMMVDKILQNLQRDTEVVIIPDEWRDEILMPKGDAGVNSFFKSLSVYQESVNNAVKMLDMSIKELDAMTNFVPEENKEQLEEDLYALVNQARTVFDQVNKLIPKVVELYTRITNSGQKFGVSCGNGDAA